MANLQRLLTRRPQIDEAELEDLRDRTMARLAALSGEQPAPAESVASADPVPGAGPAAVDVSAEPVAARTDMTTSPVLPEVVVAAVTAADVAGPTITVPRTIVLGPPSATDPEHHKPPIIVESAPAPFGSEPPLEPIAVETPLEIVAEAPLAEIEPVSDLVDITPDAPMAVAETTVEVAQPVIRATKSKAKARTKATAKPPKAAASGTATPRAKNAPAAKARPAGIGAPKRSTTTPKPTKRPAEAIPVIAEPTPVIDKTDIWPSQWRDIAFVDTGLESPDTLSPTDEIGSADTAPFDPAAAFLDELVVARRDTSQPVPRVAVVADDWADSEPPSASVAVADDPAEAVIEAPVEVEARVEVEAPIVADPPADIVIEPPVVAVAERATPGPTPASDVAAVAPNTTTSPARKPAPRRPAARPRPVAAPPVRAAATVSAAPVGATFCPYCALALDPAPTSSRRCTRCRQKIVVKRVQGRVVFLTEAAVEVFDSERLRSANFGRWSKERAGWLKLAASVHADPDRITRLGKTPLSDKVVASARTLYTSTAERQFREAKREDRWEDASHLKRDQAAAMYRLAGSPIPPDPEVVAMHREAVAAELRGIAKMAKEVGLVGGDCCDACRADDGAAFRIANELKGARLPHDGCPKGLCHCRWDLNMRDRTMVERYLRRSVRGQKASRPPA